MLAFSRRSLRPADRRLAGRSSWPKPFSRSSPSAAQRQTLGIANIQWNILDSATLLTPDPSSVTPESILSALPAFSPRLHPDSHVPLLLVTPAFAPWLEHGHAFLPRLLKHCFRDAVSAHNVEICSVEAVVDRIPEVACSDAVGGMEGLSLALVNWGTISGKVVPPQKALANISPAHLAPKLSIAVQHPTSNAEIEITMPTASTLFTTGRQYTMHASRWESARSADPTPQLRDRRDLRRCRVQLRTTPTLALFQAPLCPVTEPRRVADGMGNILRTVSDGANPNATLPASTELEKAIPRYIKQHGLEDRRLAVWALVTPESIAASHNAADVPASLRKGSRLYRLVGGGGGWGKKKGLLSLDPEYSFEDEEPNSGLVSIHEIFDDDTVGSRGDDTILLHVLEDTPSFIEGDGTQISPLREVARTGDVVQFLVAPLDASSTDGPCPEIAVTGDQCTQLCFGVVPAPTDAPARDTAGIQRARRTIIQQSTFGACSEKSMVYARDVGVRAEGPDETLASGTKIDVPGARIVVHLPREVPIS